MNAKSCFLVMSLKQNTRKRNCLLLAEAARTALIIGAAGAAAYTIDAVFLAHKGLMEIAPVLLVLFLLMAAIPLMSLPRDAITQALSTVLRTDVREQLHASILASGAAAEETRKAVLPLALEETDALDLWFSRVLPVLLAIVTTMPLILITAAIADPITGLLMLVTMPISPFLLYLIGRVTKTASEAQWKRMEEIAARFGELLRTLPALKLFHQEAAQRKKVETLSDEFSASALRVLRLSFLSAFALELITTLSIAIIAVSIGFRLLYGQMSFLTAFFVLLITPEFYQPLRQAGTAFHSAMTAWTAEQAIRAVQTEKQAGKRDAADTKDEAMPSNFTLRAEKLSFHYPNAHESIVQELSLTLRARTITALKGASGCGKSTLIRLLAGLLSPSAGRISIGNIPLASDNAARLRSYVSYVPQEPHLYNGTLAENVTLFHAASEEDIRRALHAAALGDWLETLPNGLQTRLGEGGQSLSQGQRKRLGLARAMIQNRPIVLLDEPTAGLDDDTRITVHKALRALGAGRTVLLISHDEKACAMADTLLDWEVIA